MAHSPRKAVSPKTRRTTLTLPAASLARAERIARARHVNVSAVIAESMEEGLAIIERERRSQEVLDAYRRAFGSLREEERELVDGIVVDSARKAPRTRTR